MNYYILYHTKYYCIWQQLRTPDHGRRPAADRTGREERWLAVLRDRPGVTAVGQSETGDGHADSGRHPSRIASASAAMYSTWASRSGSTVVSPRSIELAYSCSQTVASMTAPNAR